MKNQQPTARAQWIEARTHLWTLAATVGETVKVAAVKRLETVQVPFPRWLDLTILRIMEAWETIPAPIRAAFRATVSAIALAVALTIRETVTFIVGFTLKMTAKVTRKVVTKA